MRRLPILLVDVMGTLVHDPFYAEVPRFLGLAFDELLALKHPHRWVEFEYDRIDEATFLQGFFRDGRAYDGPGLKRTMAQSFEWLPGIEPLMAELHGDGVEMHALSNYPRWYLEIERRLGLSRFLAWSFVSCETGLRKPDPRAFLAAAERLGIAPEQALVIDDREENCHAARELGFDALRFRSDLDLRRDLYRRGIHGSG